MIREDPGSRPIISVRDLRKSFKGRRGKGRPEIVEAVRGIELSVAEGEIFGFLGPNGAGKSTTLRILSTLLAADAGEVTIAGSNVRNEPRDVRKQIGYVSQAGGTDPLATGRENLLLQARLYGLDRARAGRRAEELIESLGLGEFIDRFAKNYSGGQRRKLDIAIGMVHSPKILFLDEPTTGLDPVSRSQLWAQIRLLRKMGTTVFLTTHYMEEADALCDRVAIMDHGRIVAEGTPGELKGGIHGDIISLTVNHIENAPEVALGVLRELEIVREATAEGGSLRLVVTRGGEALPVVLRLLEGRGIGVADIALSRPSLDDVFLRATGHSLRDEGAVAAAGAARVTSAIKE
ncbi:MAG: ATP-binding cassette domain-containing protein [Spirochaetia bacterium]|jgi:ABC-2 type transport system ATP-binding protein